MANFNFTTALPTYPELPELFCVACNRRESSKGFVNLVADQKITDSSGTILYETDGYLCGTCVERTIISELGGISIEGRNEVEEQIARAEKQMQEAEERASSLRFRVSGVKRLFGFPEPPPRESIEQEATRLSGGGHFCFYCGAVDARVEILPFDDANIWIHPSCAVASKDWDGDNGLRNKLEQARASTASEVGARV